MQNEINEIDLRELDISLRENGFKNVEDAVGTGVDKWL